jgi:hypothetical protein
MIAFCKIQHSPVALDLERCGNLVLVKEGQVGSLVEAEESSPPDC